MHGPDQYHGQSGGCLVGKGKEEIRIGFPGTLTVLGIHNPLFLRM